MMLLRLPAFFFVSLTLMSGLILSSCQSRLSQLAEGVQEADVEHQYKYAYHLLKKGEDGDIYRQCALKWFLVGCEKGYAPSQVGAAACYQFGLSGETDLEKAEYWYLKAALQGNVNAYRGLISLALERDDIKSAAPWLRQLALQGDVVTQMAYARMLSEGIGVKRNPRDAVDFWRYAAMQGNGDACLMMGVCYSQGWGLPVNQRLAHAWWRMAEEAGNGAAKSLLKEN